MGRRGVALESEQDWVFNRLAEAYRHRVGYPSDLVDRLVELSSGGRVADIGAGMGHLAHPLAGRGLRVAAVEPAREMLAGIAAPVEPHHATAEATGLPAGAFSLVVFADAVQWVDPDLAGREAGRLLQPSGVCAVVEAELGGNAFMDALLERLGRSNPKTPRQDEGRARHLLSMALGPRALSQARFIQEEVLDPERLGGTLKSISCVGPALGPAALEALLRDAEALAVRHGRVWRRELTLRFGVRPGSSTRRQRPTR